MTTTTNKKIAKDEKEMYDKISSLTLRKEDRMALLRAKRERAIILDRNLTMTTDLRRKLKGVSDRILEALYKYEDYIAKALTAYDNYTPCPHYIEINFWINGDKDHRHLSYPEWYYQMDYKASRQQRLEIAQLEKEMAQQPNWVDVNDALYCEDYRTDIVNDSIDCHDPSSSDNWLRMRWYQDCKVRVADIIAQRERRMDELSRKDAEGISEAFYRLKDMYCLALEDMLDITEYKVDHQAKIINY